MRITVLGNNGPYPDEEGACSSFLVCYSGQTILCDLGAGSLKNLFRVVHPENLDCIIITHCHFDHCSDFFVLKYYYSYLKSRNLLHRNISLYLPDDPISTLLDDKEVFQTCAIRETDSLILDSMVIRFSETNHPVLCYGVSWEAGNRKIVYTSDTVYTDKMVKFSCRADLLIANCGLLNGQSGNHLTAGECGRLAKEAGVSSMLLSHLHPMNDVSTALRQAKQYHADTAAAEIMQIYS